MLLDKTPRHQHLLSGVLSWPDSPCLPSIPAHIPYTSAWEMIPKDTCYAWGFLSVRLSSGTWWTWFPHCLVSTSPHLVFPCSRPFSNMLSSFFPFFFSFLLTWEHADSFSWLSLCFLQISEQSYFLKGVFLALYPKSHWPVFPFPLLEHLQVFSFSFLIAGNSGSRLRMAGVGSREQIKHNFSQLCIQWPHISRLSSTHGGRTYTTEISICYKAVFNFSPR